MGLGGGTPEKGSVYGRGGGFQDNRKPKTKKKTVVRVICYGSGGGGS